MSKALFADVKKMGIISIDDDSRKVRVVRREAVERSRDEDRERAEYLRRHQIAVLRGLGSMFPDITIEMADMLKIERAERAV
jgi:hypothetical protein